MATVYGEHGTGNGKRERVGSRVPAVLAAPFQARTWREFGFLLVGLPLSTLYFGLAIAGVSTGAGLLVTFLGVPMLAGALMMCRGFGAAERARVRGLLGVRIAAPEPVRPRKAGPLSWMGAVLKSGSAWRHLLYALLHFPWAVFTFSMSVALMAWSWSTVTYPLWFWVFPTFTDQPGLQLFQNGDYTFHLEGPGGVALAFLLGVALLLVTPWVIRAFAAVDTALIRGLLGPSRLAHRVTELESDRGVVVDTAAADLRRIERDLHDGAQARLVNLAMDLGLAKEKVTEDPQAAARMVDEAHGEVKIALQELRDLARGIHPAVLTDRGLDAALSSVATRCPVPVRVEVDLPQRPAPAIEGIAYFTVSELLQNVGKHAGATAATVDVWRSADRLLLQVTDDGRGGAEAAPGGGLAGLAERIGAVDGVLLVESPAGTGTKVTAELPWRPRTAGH
ncbi:sensor domain-containing protein [Streptomyces sp. NPDC097619]|uniref:sensor histidine kinase n=1 Tax=Streptomyces sp. NPDC097619 TaxID=3157228 RepID=UPI003334752C